MENKTYKLVKNGTGHSPHILENPADQNDKLFLCSCGGTKNANGHCDGTHNTKKDTGCECNFCKTMEQRTT